MATIKEIAAEAGVSVMTVSNVVHNNLSKVSPATVERVRRIIDKYNYVPNMAARSLITHASHIVAVLLPLWNMTAASLLHDPYAGNMAGMLETLLREKGTAQQRAFHDICEKNDFTVNDFRDQWTDFSEFLSYLPAAQAQNHRSILGSTAVQEMRDTRSHYYFRIDTVRREGDAIPLERIRPTIRRILFNQRQGEVIRRHEEELLTRGLEENKVRLFLGETERPDSTEVEKQTK